MNETTKIITATSEKPSTVWFERCFRGFWLLMGTLLSYMFLGSMKASLIVLTPTSRIDDLGQLLQHPELTIFYGGKTPGENILNVSTSFVQLEFDPRKQDQDSNWYRILQHGLFIQEVRGELGARLKKHLRLNSDPVIPFNNLHSNHVRDALARGRGAIAMEEKFIRMGISKWCVESPFSFYIAEHPILSFSTSVYASRQLPLELRYEMSMK